MTARRAPRTSTRARGSVEVEVAGRRIAIRKRKGDLFAPVLTLRQRLPELPRAIERALPR